jgi:multidrug transporter EmrE-like cation transporter
MSRSSAFFVALLLTLIGVVADALLKVASQQQRLFQTGWFAGGLLCFIATAFGWALVMKELKLSTVAGIYSVGTVLCLTLVSVIIFRESLSRAEAIGLFLAIISLVLLGRFGD